MRSKIFPCCSLTQEIQFLEFMGRSNLIRAHSNYLICMTVIIWIISHSIYTCDNGVLGLYASSWYTFCYARIIKSLHLFRHYVTSHLPKLCYLDDTAVSQSERESAQRIYGRRRVGRTNSERKDSSTHVRVCEGVWGWGCEGVWVN